MTKETEKLSDRLLVSVNQARLVVKQMVKNSSLPQSKSEIEEGRPPRLGLGARFIPHSQVAKYDPKIKRLLSKPTERSRNSTTDHSSKSKKQKEAVGDQEDDDSSKYSNF